MKGVSKVAMITAYDALFARLADAAGADIILVGDSLGNTFMGFDSTVPVTLEMMAHHTAAVARANPDAMVLADIPFGCAGMSFDRLLDDCRALYQKAGAEAVKIEGGAEIAEKVAGLASAGRSTCRMGMRNHPMNAMMCSISYMGMEKQQPPSFRTRTA